MNVATIISIIGICISAISVITVVYFNSKGSKRVDTKDIEERVRENTKVNMKLDSISSNTQDIKHEISAMREEMQSHNDRIIKVEESAKQAHHRITGLEERLIAILEGGKVHE